jgi:hypothetical protein
MAKMPKYFKEAGYKSPTDPRNGALQYAFKTKEEAFDYWRKSPEILENFNTFMTGVRGSRPSWIEWFPMQERVFDGYTAADSSVLLVDIGGGRGHDTEAFRKRFPNLKGRLVLQDLPAVIDDIKTLDESIEQLKHDFFTPQPVWGTYFHIYLPSHATETLTVTGARVYFFHFIFHDWSDEACLKILANTVPAMRKGYSKLLLNEFILPDKGSPLFPAGMDLNMMAMHAGQERTQNQWQGLLAKAGLEAKFWYSDGDGEAVVEAELI